MNFGRAFTFVQEDPDWLKKLGIAMLVMFIPIIGQLTVFGWSLEIIRRVINDEPETLPDWNDFGKYIGNGLKELVIGLVYALPAILMYGCGFAAVFGLAAVAGGSTDSGSDANSALGGVAGIGMMCVYCMFILFIIFAALLVPPALGMFAATGELSAAFRFAEIFALLRAGMGPYILSLLVIAFVAPIATSIGSIACGIGAFFALAYVRAVSSHLFGQAYKIARANQSSASAS